MHVWQVGGINVQITPEISECFSFSLLSMSCEEMGFHERQGQGSKSTGSGKDQSASQPKKETTLFYHNTHNGSIPL